MKDWRMFLPKKSYVKHINEGIRFLMTKGLSPVLSSYMISIAWLGYALGCPLLGYLSDKYEHRKPFIIFSAITTLLSLISIIYLPAQQILTGISFFLFGFGVSGSSLGYALAAEQSKEDNLALILGFNNMIIVLFTLFGSLFQSTLLTHTAHPFADLELLQYQKVFIWLIVLLVPAIIFSLRISETFCKSQSINTKLTPRRPKEEQIMLNEVS